VEKGFVVPLKSYLRSALTPIYRARFYYHLPNTAKSERRKDLKGLGPDYGIEAEIAEAIAWLERAQDNSLSHDGGVARDFSLINGWSNSYPETTGYIIPTLLAYSIRRNDETIKQRTLRMLDWLVSIQFAEGGFQGGVIGSQPRVPVTFNTGQILLGLASGAKLVSDEYREPMRRAADWLVETQDADGCWRKHPSPFAEPGEKVYETHVAWGLLEAATVDGNRNYAEAALANIRWALKFQQPNGWFQQCCLSDPAQPLTHTIGYALRGILEGYLFTKDPDLLAACCRTADGLIEAISPSGFLPGRLDANWCGTVNWACLTGSLQIAYCLFVLAEHTENHRYRTAARALNSYVRRTISIRGRPETRGAVKGAFPVSGNYCSYEYPNWAVKFFIDSNLFEFDVSEDS